MENFADILVEKDDVEKVEEAAAQMKAMWRNEFLGEEPSFAVKAEVKEEMTTEVFDKESTDKIVDFLLVIPNGVQGVSRKLEGLTESSLNIGAIETDGDIVRTKQMLRSSVESIKQYMRVQMEQIAKRIGATTWINNEYPAWQYNPDSELRKTMEKIFRDMYGKEPVVFAVHAGLECGLFLGKKPDLDCVSIGPNLLDIHSFSEKLDIASTERVWNYLLAVLAELK